MLSPCILQLLIQFILLYGLTIFEESVIVLRGSPDTLLQHSQFTTWHCSKLTQNVGLGEILL